MLVEKVQGEVDNCRHRLMKYCRGQGLDLGCGNAKIRTDAIGIDLYSPLADMNCDAQLLEQYPSGQFDYVFSSHLLEELDSTEAILREWLRVVKNGGNLVLYQADQDLYYPFGHPQCNPRHKHHFTWESLWGIIKNIGGVKLVHHGRNPDKEWSFELVVRKSDNDEEPQMTGEGISLLIPTLKRPPGMQQLAVSVDQTTKYPEGVEIVFGIHEDDQPSMQKAVELKDRCKIAIRYEYINRPPDGKVNLPILWNQIYAKAAHPIMGYFGDDVIFHTPGWDEEVRREFTRNKTIMVCCNDVHVQKGKVATLFFTHKAVHDAFGFYLPERFRRWYNDTYWDRVYRWAGKLHYREDLVMEHLHPDKFPERADQVYKNMEMFKDSDAQLWFTQATQDELHKNSKILEGMKL